MHAGEYVQFGSGFSAPAGWLNFDVSPTLRFERLPILGKFYTRNEQRFPKNVWFGDVVRGLPIAASSCRGLYCSHVLEHLALDEVDLALKNCFQHLKRGGTFRMVLPDLERLAKDYIANKTDAAAYQFMNDSYLGVKSRARGFGGLMQVLLGNSKHLWMWDERALATKLGEHGFYDIRRAAFGDAEDEKFTEVEDAERFEGCLAMQCRK